MYYNLTLKIIYKLKHSLFIGLIHVPKKTKKRKYKYFTYVTVHILFFKGCHWCSQYNMFK